MGTGGGSPGGAWSGAGSPRSERAAGGRMPQHGDASAGAAQGREETRTRGRDRHAARGLLFGRGSLAI